MYNENPITPNENGNTSPEELVTSVVQPAVSECNEIIYNADKKSEGYNIDYVTTRKKKKAPRNKGMGLKIAAIIIAALFTLSLCALTGTYIYKSMTDIFSRASSGAALSETIDLPVNIDKGVFRMDVPSVTNGKIPVEEMATKKENGALTINQIADKCLKSSVGIKVEKVQYYFGSAYSATGVGSGFILSEDGYIATNHHVISGASAITVVLYDGTEYEAKVIGSDSLTDVGVIKIDAKDLPVMERGNSDEVLVGDLAVAIGTPASIELTGTVTDGIISAVNRKIDMTDSYGRVVKTMTFIQTNATINPGNSGGPLINQYGQVIGINTLKLTDKYEGIGFAIPINGAISIMNQIIADGAVSDRSDGLVTGKASIGIQCSNVTEEEAEYYGIPMGVLVMQINKDGSAAKAGLRRGDIIIAFNGETVKTTEEINTIKEKFNAGDKATLTVYRDGEGTLDISFNLDPQAE